MAETCGVGLVNWVSGYIQQQSLERMRWVCCSCRDSVILWGWLGQLCVNGVPQHVLERVSVAETRSAGRSAVFCGVGLDKE